MKMKKYYLKILLVLGVVPIFGQTAQMDVNYINAKVVPDGLFFMDSVTSSPGFEALKDSGTHSIFSSSLWFSGISAYDSTLKGTYARYAGQFNGFASGPLEGLNNINPGNRPYGAGTLSPATELQYKKVFVVTKMEIDSFVAWFNCGLNPSCNQSVSFPGYSIPNSILDWPGNGDVSLLQDQFLAPFIDYNSDGLYDPNSGDYPCIKGDKYAFFVMNDTRANAAGATSIKTEVRVGVYAFDTLLSSPLSRTIFVEYDLINRGTDSIIDFYVSAFADIDIGCLADDYVGTLVDENTIFGYNSDSFDDGCAGSSVAYNNLPPAQGVTLLNHQLESSVYFNNSFGSANGDPQNFYEVRNNQKGIWKNGQDIVVGGSGVSGSIGSTSIVTKHVFPYDTVSGQPYWTEHTANTPSGDRRIIGTAGSFTFGPGETIELDLAYTFSKADTGDQLTSVDLLKQDVAVVQDYYDNQIPSDCYYSSGGSVSIEENLASKVRLYPNPFSSIVNIEIKDVEIKSIVLTKVDGAIIKNIAHPTSHLLSVNLEEFSKGIYFVQITSEKGSVLTKKIIKN